MQSDRAVWLLLVLLISLPARGGDIAPVHMANGIKIGEVSSTSAIIWTRLTENAEGNADGTPFPKHAGNDGNAPGIGDLSTMEGSAPGTAGEVRLHYWPEDNESEKVSTEWQAVEPDRDFTRQIRITDLQPGTRYQLRAEGRASGDTQPSSRIEGAFVTAPSSETVAPVFFAAVTCQEYLRRDTSRGHQIYPVMQKLNPDFFVHTGDIVYYDRPRPVANTLELARFKWNRMYAMPNQRAFHNRTASYFMKDDHDTLKNDCWPGQTFGNRTWEQGLALFREQVPMGDKTYRTIRWGKDLQIWLVEGRDFRSPNTLPDGPEKTIWGAEQKQWFFDTVKKSDATFRILITPTPIVGPDRSNKNDNHANAGFTHEGDELRSFIGQQTNMFIICGDRHWQYITQDPKTGVREYACGPTADKHARGFSENNRTSMHHYLKMKGGFLTVAVDRKEGYPRAVLTHHGVDGSVYNQDILRAKN